MDFLTSHGETIAQPAFRVLAYIDGSLNNAPDQAAAAQIFELFTARFIDDVAWVILSAGKPGQAAPPSSETLAPLRDWISSTSKDQYQGARMNGPVSEEMEAVTVPHFNVFEHFGMWVVELSVPQDAPDIVGFADAVTAILATVSTRCAVMGMGFYQPLALEHLETFLPLAFSRFKAAIEIPVTNAIQGTREAHSTFPFDQHKEVKEGIVDVGWRTIVGAPYLDRLADQTPPVHPGVVFEAEDTQMVLTAGGSPIWGDVNAGEDIGAYQAVAAYLDAVRYHPDVAYKSLFGSTYNDADKRDRVDGYLARFDVARAAEGVATK